MILETLRKNKKNNIEALIFLSPFIFLFLLLRFYPFISGFIISLFKRDILGIRNEFVGLENYLLLIKDPTFWKAIGNTLKYIALVTPLLVPISLILALLLNKSFKGSSIFRGIFFVPRILSVAVVSLIWLWVYQPEWGLLNFYLKKVLLLHQNWLNHPFWAFLAIVMVDTWWCAGYNMIIFLAGLQQIPKTLYEAAYIDGSNKWQCFIYITLPGLKPSLLFVLVVHIIGAFQIFGIFWIMTQGGPYGSTRLMVQYIYENGFTYFKMGYASSLAYVLFLLILVFTLIQFRFLRNTE